MRNEYNKPILTIIAIVLFSIIFFQLVYTSFNSIIKAVLLIILFALSGFVISKILDVSSSFSLLLVKSKKGLNAIEELGIKHKRLFTELADLGLSISYGIPYSIFLFYKTKNWLKLIIHIIISFTLYYFLIQFTPSFPLMNEYSMLLVTSLFGLFGLALASLVTSSYSILLAKTAQSSVAPVIPGVTLPLSEGIVALIFVAVVHELAHGVLCATEKIKVNNIGAILFGFLPIGAFVEPDEKSLAKSKIWSKRRVLIAGSSSNLVFFVLLLPIALSIGYILPFMASGYSINPSSIQVPTNHFSLSGQLVSINGTAITSQTNLNQYFQPGGILAVNTTNGTQITPSSFVLISTVDPNSAAYGKLKVNSTILSINSTPIYSVSELQNALGNYSVDQPVPIGTSSGNYIVSKGNDGKIGIAVEQVPAFNASLTALPQFSFFYWLLYFLYSTIGLASVLSLAVAMVNVLPLFFTDGHKMFQEEFAQFVDFKKASKIAMFLSLIVLLLIVINLSRWLGIF